MKITKVIMILTLFLAIKVTTGHPNCDCHADGAVFPGPCSTRGCSNVPNHNCNDGPYNVVIYNGFNFFTDDSANDGHYFFCL